MQNEKQHDARFSKRAIERVTSIAGIGARLGTYLVLDNWINIVHAGLAVFLKAKGASFPQLFLVIWLFDFVVATAFVIVYEMTGKDFSLGVDLRQAADALYKKSRLIAYTLTFWNIVLSIVWFGPERVVTYYRKEIGSRLRLVVALVALTGIQAFLWACLYSYAYDFVVRYL